MLRRLLVGESCGVRESARDSPKMSVCFLPAAVHPPAPGVALLGRMGVWYALLWALLAARASGTSSASGDYGYGYSSLRLELERGRG